MVDATPKFLHVIKSSPQHELPASVASVTSNATGVGVIMPSTQHELPASVASAANSTTLVESNATGAGSSVSALPVLPVIVRNPYTMVEIQAYALLDSGSTNSFCSSELVTKLNVRGHSSMLTLSTLGAKHTLVNTASVGLEVVSIDKSAVLSLPEVFVRDKLPINLNNRAKPTEIQAWPHLKDITLSEANVSEVSLLIGQDCPEALVPEEVRRGEAGSPYAVRTVLGWTINGLLRRRTHNHMVSNFIQSELQQQVEQFFKLENVAIQLNRDSGMSLSVNDQKALKIWNDNWLR